MLSYDIAQKYWGHVEKKLLDIENTDSYYAGGTLSISLGKDRGIALNLDGTGFVMNRHTLTKNQSLYQPPFILSLVRSVYLRVKGKTEHYQASIKKDTLNA